MPTKSPPSATMMLLLDMTFSRLYSSFSGFKCCLTDSCDLILRETQRTTDYKYLVTQHVSSAAEEELDASLQKVNNKFGHRGKLETGILWTKVFAY